MLKRSMCVWTLFVFCAFYSFHSFATEADCSLKFRQLVAAVHRPGFEQSRDIPQTGTSYRWAQWKTHLYSVAKLFRRPKQASPQARQKAIETVDRFFDEVIKGYPEPTQALLKKFYYENSAEVYTKELYLNSSQLANWHLNKNNIQGFSVEFDEGLRDAELIRKLFLIHEAAVHIGQFHQRVLQVGGKQTAEEHGTQDGYMFTEMSAALAEKTVLSSLDFSVVEAETNKITDPATRLGTLSTLYLMKNISPDQYVELLHRRESVTPTPAQVEEFLRDPDGP